VEDPAADRAAGVVVVAEEAVVAVEAEASAAEAVERSETSIPRSRMETSFIKAVTRP